jgi:hypothetical protein
MRVCLIILSVLGFGPGLLLVVLTFFGFPQLFWLTEKLTGPEPEYVRFYKYSTTVAGEKYVIEVVPRILVSKTLPASLVILGTAIHFAGVIWYFCRQ